MSRSSQCILVLMSFSLCISINNLVHSGIFSGISVIYMYFLSTFKV